MARHHSGRVASFRQLVSCCAALFFISLALLSSFQVKAAESDERFNELQPLINKETNVLTFTSVNVYRKYVQKAGRDYDFFVMLVSCLGLSEKQTSNV